MFGLDEHIAELAGGNAFVVVAIIAVLLGLRHATDPDHLTAVIVLMQASGERKRAASAAAGIGLAWGSGHATTLILLGLPIILFQQYLPEAVQSGAEVLVGVMIIGLAVRLLVRSYRTRVHAHEHRHGEVVHVHLHVHELTDRHRHLHPGSVSRSGHQAYAVGLIHGVGGTAGIGVLLLAAIPNAVQGAIALVLFAGFTALSMAAATMLFGMALSGRALQRHEQLTPALGVLSLAFGVWYVLGAIEVVPYVF